MGSFFGGGVPLYVEGFFGVRIIGCLIQCHFQRTLTLILAAISLLRLFAVPQNVVCALPGLLMPGISP